MRGSILATSAAFVLFVLSQPLLGLQTQEKDDAVFWGPENPSGIRLGVSINHTGEECFAGQQIRPRFHFRNDTDEPIDFDHPTIVQAVWLIADAKDQQGEPIEVQLFQDRAWIAGAMAGNLDPGAVGIVYGPMIRIGGSDYADEQGLYQMAVGAEVGQEVQLSFQLDDFIAAVPTAKTGSIPLRMVDPVGQIRQRMDELGDWMVGEFSSVRYMEVASILMSFKPEDRIDLMKELCKSHNDEMIVLCRMLFTAPEGQAIRRPRIGMPEFWAGAMEDWPQEPICIVDRVPILVTRGYGGTGVPESALVYLSFCLSKKYDWTTESYYFDGPWQLSHALNQFLELRAWSDKAKNFFQSQIELPDAKSE